MLFFITNTIHHIFSRKQHPGCRRVTEVVFAAVGMLGGWTSSSSRHGGSGRWVGVSWCRVWFACCRGHSEARALLQMSQTSLPVIRSLWQFGTRGWACVVCLHSRNSASQVPPGTPFPPTACPQAAVVQAGLCQALGKSVFLGEEWSPWKVFCPLSG